MKIGYREVGYTYSIMIDFENACYWCQSCRQIFPTEPSDCRSYLIGEITWKSKLRCDALLELEARFGYRIIADGWLKTQISANDLAAYVRTILEDNKLLRTPR